jgi:Tfp pilus assembly protein PilF
LRLTGLGGKVTGNELQRIADHHRVNIDIVRRRASTLGIQIGEGKQENYQALYTKYYSQKPDNAAVFDQMAQYLASFSVENLYEFLSDDTPGAGLENASCDDLRNKAEEKRKKEFYRNDARSTAGQRLCGYCQSAFKDERSKAVYDSYLLYSHTKTLLETVKSQYNISGKLSEELSEKFGADLTEVLKERKLALEVLVAFCEVERIPYTLSKSSLPGRPPAETFSPDRSTSGSSTSDKHSDAGQPLNKLASDVRRQDKNSEEEPLLRRALAIREKVLGPEHLDTAISLDNLAVCVSNQGRDSEAETLFKRVLEIRGKKLGLRHPDTVTVLNNFVSCLNIQGKHSEAKKIRERYQKGKSPLDSSPVGSSPTDSSPPSNLPSGSSSARKSPTSGSSSKKSQTVSSPVESSPSSDLRRQSRDSEEELLLRRALTIREKVLGPKHLDTATSLDNLAVCVGNQGRHSEAQQLLKRVFEIKDKELGLKHPDTIKSLNNLVLNLRSQGKYSEVTKVLERYQK